MLGESPIAVSDLLAVLGRPDAKMRFSLGMASSWDVELPLWSPGVVAFSLLLGVRRRRADGSTMGRATRA